MTIALPKTPDGDAYEDLVAGSLKVLGYFTETRLVLRSEKKDVLELDVVATPVGATSTEKCLFEAKKDGISFTNIFKLFGQRSYLQIPSACLVSHRPCEPVFLGVYETKASEMGVRLCNYTLESSGPESLADPKNNLTVVPRAQIMPAAWYQQIARRLVYAAFNQECASNKQSSLHQRARDYNLAVQGSFFHRTPLARAEALYNAYSASPRLTGEAVSAHSAAKPVKESVIWNKVNDTAELLWIQHLMFVESMARLSILKNALDDIHERGDSPIPTGKLKIGKVVIDWPLHVLPARFLAGLELVRKHRHALRLPYLFQVFSELFGGFLFFDDQSELTVLAELTGIPSGEIVDCLLILDNFFAPAGGTFFYRQMNELLCMKMVPGFVRGGGSFLRQSIHGFSEYVERYPKSGWLLGKWHNALYYTLEPALRQPAAA